MGSPDKHIGPACVSGSLVFASQLREHLASGSFDILYTSLAPIHKLQLHDHTGEITGLIC